MQRQRVASALMVVAMLAVSSRAAAAPTARLVYIRGQGAETCPDEDALRHSVMGHLGYDPFRPFVQPTLFAEVRRDGERFIGSVKMVDERGIERGARTLEGRGDDCNEIMAAMALSMSIAIDPRSALRTPASPPRPTVNSGEAVEDATTELGIPPQSPAPQSPAPQPPPLPPNPDVPPPPSRAHARPRLGAGLGAYAVAGEGAQISAGARLSGEVAWTKLSAGAELRASLPTTFEIAGGGAVRTSLMGAAVVPCWRVRWASACAVGFVGRMQTETIDVVAPTSRAFVHVAAGMRLAADVPLGEGIAVRLAGDALGTIAPFVVEVDHRRVYESPALAGLVGATLVYFF